MLPILPGANLKPCILTDTLREKLSPSKTVALIHLHAVRK